MSENRYFYGFDLIFAIFVLAYFIRWLYAFRRLSFLRKHFFEGILVLIILVNGISVYVFSYQLIPELLALFEIKDPVSFYQTTITVFVFVILFMRWEWQVPGSAIPVSSLPRPS